MNNETTTTRKLETETCTRCGGSGNYSYCQSYGTRCFKCRGRGITYTTRGQAAAKYFYELCCKPLAEVAIGDVILCQGVPGFVPDRWITVETVGVSESRSKTGDGPWITHHRPDVSGKDRHGADGGICAEATHPVRVAQTAEQKAQKLALALEYQATLTKVGTPRKRVAKAEPSPVMPTRI